MDIKLKNKYGYTFLFIMSIYLIGFALFSSFNVFENRKYLSENYYFNSSSFSNELRNYTDNVRLFIEYQKKGLENGFQAQNIKNNINSTRNMKYLIKDNKSGETFTNLENTSNIDVFIKNQALFSTSFPQSSIKDYNYQVINSWFKSNDFQGYFIVLNNIDGYNQLAENNKYYNSIRERLRKEIILAIFSFAIGLFVLIYILKNKKNELTYFEKVLYLYDKIPLDLRIVTFIIYVFTMLNFQMNINFFYFPINIYHMVKLTVMALYSYYLVINIIILIKLIKNKNELSEQWCSSFLYKFWDLVRESFVVKSTIFKLVAIIILTIIAGLFMVTTLLADGELMIFSLFYELLYIIIIIPYILKRIVIFNRILLGTDEIASGNLNYCIEEGKSGRLSELAHNVNNMKEGFKKSVESQVKSERLKSELITNVSHDLKTPLTSIINYINLLKNEDLSSDERNSYIEVLDKKSLRLKILIEDLFEASKMASGAVELYLEKVDLVAILKQTMGEFDEKIKNCNLTFKLNASKPNIYANLDGKKTWRVFENLIGNILKYSQPNTRVYIDIMEYNSDITITMKNISSYELDFDVEEIFERFKRGDKSRNTEGSGLGLAIAKSIVELHGGKLSIELDGDLFKAIIEFNNKSIKE